MSRSGCFFFAKITLKWICMKSPKETFKPANLPPNIKVLYYRPHPKDGEGNVLTRVCLSVHRGGSGPATGGGGSGPATGGGGQVQLPGGVRSSHRGGSGPAAGGGSGPAARGGSATGGGQPPGGGSAKIGQHREYLLHGGRYASCVHAGGLSCCLLTWKI